MVLYFYYFNLNLINQIADLNLILAKLLMFYEMKTN